MEEEINWDDEFRKPKYDEIKIWIDNQARIKKYNYNEVRNVPIDVISWTFPNFIEEFSTVYSKLVDHMEAIHLGNINLNYGITIDNKGSTNSCQVPQDDRSAWQLLKKALMNKDIYSLEEISELELGTLDILKRLSLDTLNKDAVKGLVMGYVQSGKTTSMESLITMAADNGWNFFIVLSGVIENLRQQNLQRLKKDIETGYGNIHWKFSPSLKDDNVEDLINRKYKVVTVCLKNSKRLSDLKNWMLDQSAVSLQKMKVLIIDDEADQASLNSLNIEFEERTKINNLITDLVNNKKIGAMNYVAYTATPYGNFLNEFGGESLYPTTFIHMLPKSTQYFGPQEIFGNENSDDEDICRGLNINEEITNEEVNEIRNIEKNVNKNLPKSLEEAICWFLCTVAIRRYKDDIFPVSMLIHTSGRKNAHKNVSKSIEEWLLNKNVNELIGLCQNVYNKECEKFNKNDLLKIMTKYRFDINDYPSFDEIKEKLIEILTSHKPSHIPINDQGKLEFHKGIHLIIDNSSAKINDENEYIRLVYPSKEDNVQFATAFIVVGGTTLSRGLTLEGLTTSYFCRKVSQIDTLMQMGRWFGYRKGYELLPRIWLDKLTKLKFEEMTLVENSLREDLTKYNKGISPMDYGPIVQNSYRVKLSITSKNHMQSATTEHVNYVGAKAQTILFDIDDEIQNNNIKVTEEFARGLNDIQQSSIESNLVIKDVDFDHIKNQFLLKMRFCNHSSFFNNINAFCEWVSNNPNEKTKKWNVIFAGTKVGKEWDVNGHSINKITRTRLSTIDDYFSIGTLRSTKDILSDVENYPNNLKKEKDIIDFREKIEEPQLIIYRIDKDSKADGKAKRERYDLNMNEDLIGIYIFVPGKPYENYVQSVTIKIPQDNTNIDENDDDDEDE